MPDSLTELHRYAVRVFGVAPGVPATVGVPEAQSVPSVAASAHGSVVSWQGPGGVFSANLALRGGTLSNVVHHDITPRPGEELAGGGGSAPPLVEGPAIAVDDAGDRLVAWENSKGLYAQYVGVEGPESAQLVAPAPSAYTTNNFSLTRSSTRLDHMGRQRSVARDSDLSSVCRPLGGPRADARWRRHWPGRSDRGARLAAADGRCRRPMGARLVLVLWRRAAMARDSGRAPINPDDRRRDRELGQVGSLRRRQRRCRCLC